MSFAGKTFSLADMQGQITVTLVPPSGAAANVGTLNYNDGTPTVDVLWAEADNAFWFFPKDQDGGYSIISMYGVRAINGGYAGAWASGGNAYFQTFSVTEVPS